MLGAISDNTRSTLLSPTRPGPRPGRRLAKIPCTNSTPGIASIGRMSVATIRLPAHDACRVLAPAAGRRPQVDAADTGPQQPLALLDLLELEYGARAPAFALRPLDELVVGMLGEPAGAALGTFGHWISRVLYTGAMPLNEKQKKHLRRLAHPLQSDRHARQRRASPTRVVNELERALNDHELVKVSARVGDRTSATPPWRTRDRTRAKSCSASGMSGCSTARRKGLSKIILPD
jgi:hypothetical protein